MHEVDDQVSLAAVVEGGATQLVTRDGELGPQADEVVVVVHCVVDARQLLAELGPLGLLAFLVALGLVVRDLARAPREDRLRAGSVLLFAAVGAATVGPLEQKAFWLALFWAALAAPAAQPVSSRTSSSRGASATVG